ETPHFTQFEFHHTDIINQFFGVLVQGAVVQLMAGLALLERGREYNITDSSISVQVPTVSEMLSTQYSAELNNWFERVKMIKGTMRPSPLAMGTLTGTIGRAPQFNRLRWLRARSFF